VTCHPSGVRFVLNGVIDDPAEEDDSDEVTQTTNIEHGVDSQDDGELPLDVVLVHGLSSIGLRESLLDVYAIDQQDEREDEEGEDVHRDRGDAHDIMRGELFVSVA
jgi:hypothetical protein